MSGYLTGINQDLKGAGAMLISLFILNIVAAIYYFGSSIVSDSLFTDEQKYLNASLTPDPDITANYKVDYGNYIDKKEKTEVFIDALYIALGIIFSILGLVFLWRAFFGKDGILSGGAGSMRSEE